MISVRFTDNNGQSLTVYPRDGFQIPLPQLNDDLQHLEQTCQLELPYDADELQFIFSRNSLQAVVYDDSAPVFTGRVKEGPSWTDIGLPCPAESVRVDLTDNTYLMQKNTSSEVALIGKSLSQVAAFVCSACGVTASNPSELPADTVSAFVLETGRSFAQAFSDLLYQYGWSYYFNGAGEVVYLHISETANGVTGPGSGSYVALGEGDFHDKLSISPVAAKYSGVTVKFNYLVKRTKEQVYWEGNGLDSDNKVVPITLRPGQYYPYDSDPVQEAREGKVYQTFEDGYSESYKLYSGETRFRRSSKSALLYTAAHEVVQDWSEGIVIDRTDFGARQSAVRIKNTGETDAQLYQLAIRADAWYRADEAVCGLGSSDNPFEYDAEFIFEHSAASNFAHFISRYFCAQNYKIRGKLPFRCDAGVFVSISTGLSGFSAHAVSLGCVYIPAEELYEVSFLTFGSESVDSTIYKRRSSIYGNFSISQTIAKAISAIVEQYYLSASATALVGGEWLNSAPVWVPGKYIWTRTKFLFNSGDETVTDPVRVTSIDGTGVESVDVEYAQADNGAIPPESGWSTTAPAWQSGKYIWSRTVVYYTDGTQSTTAPACVTGQKGETGESIRYLGLLSQLPPQATDGAFFLCRSAFSESARLVLQDGNLLVLQDGNHLLLTKGFVPGFLYELRGGVWYQIPDKNDYRYISATNDLIAMGWRLADNLQQELDDLDNDAQGYAATAQANATAASTAYTDSKVTPLAQQVSTKIDYVPQYLGRSSADPGNGRDGDWYLNTASKNLRKRTSGVWGDVPAYSASTAYMYNAAAKDCLDEALSQGNAGAFAAAFIASIFTRNITLDAGVGTMQSQGWDSDKFYSDSMTGLFALVQQVYGNDFSQLFVDVLNAGIVSGNSLYLNSNGKGSAMAELAGWWNGSVYDAILRLMPGGLEGYINSSGSSGDRRWGLYTERLENQYSPFMRHASGFYVQNGNRAAKTVGQGITQMYSQDGSAGYVVFATGLCIQWGGVKDASVRTGVSLHLAYRTDSYQVFVSALYGGPFSFSDLLKTGAVFEVFGSGDFSWLTIGLVNV